MTGKHAKGCHCPFCEEELKKGCVEPPFCRTCDQVVVIECASCGKRVNGKSAVCPECGAPLKKKR
jgi:hypothetical protein